MKKMFYTFLICSSVSGFSEPAHGTDIPTNDSLANITTLISFKQDGNHYLCSGVVINKTHVLTAAHCGQANAKDYIISFPNISDNTVYKVKAVSVHENYIVNKRANDLAMLTLATPLNQNDFVKLSNTPLNVGDNLYVLGYGAIEGEQPNPKGNVLQKSPIKVGGFTDNNTFIRYDVSYYGACHGDSGGPLVNDKYELAGLVSGGDNCGTSNAVEFDTNTYLYNNWIINKANVY